jgi:hypothetical protein
MALVGVGLLGCSANKSAYETHPPIYRVTNAPDVAPQPPVSPVTNWSIQAAKPPISPVTNAWSPPAKPPAPLPSNVVAQRTVRDVIQTLVRVDVPTNLASPAIVPTGDTNWAAVAEQAKASGTTLVTNTFAGFVPGSLAEVVWSGFHTNGRSTRIWEYWNLPPGWPTNPPVLRWDTNNLMWGRKGMTAISQVCEGMGAFGQGALTLLTRRHAYLRGHGMGASGLHPERVGVRVWYCTRDNQVIERKIKLLVVRAPGPGSPGDYSLALFDADLPAGIEPMRVVDQVKLHRKYMFGDMQHKPIFMPLQGGNISGGVPGWIIPFAGGDSGTPTMLPLPDELVFFGGLTTSPPSAAIQADMDMLSRQAGLDPSRYQMQWLDLDRYPDFAMGQ